VQRAVLDPGVLVSALISPTGAAANLLVAAREGEFELVVSLSLLEELDTVLRRPKFRRYLDLETVDDYLRLVGRQADPSPDPTSLPPVRCADPDDDYLIALAHSQAASIVSGGRHLLAMADAIPVFSPAGFLTRLT
jgi:putative PIN family toxin of toxin-antitoxin system